MTEPRRYRKKPVVIEAMQYTGDNSAAILAWGEDSRTVSVWGGKHLCIKTLEGEMYASVGDWIIKGIKGEFYPCKTDIFEATYEEASDD